MKNFSAKSYTSFLAIILAFFSGGVQWFGGFQHWDDMMFDQQLNLFPEQANTDIVVIKIDDWSIANLGRWPWSRNVHAELINGLTEVQVQAIGLDILFLDPDLNNPAADSYLAEAIRRNGRVVLPALVDLDDKSTQVRITLPIDELSKAVELVGHTTIKPDKKGVVRGVYLSAQVAGPISEIPSFVKALSAVEYSQIDKRGFPNTGQIILSKNVKDSPFSDYVRIPFSGNHKEYLSLSYIDVLKSEKLRKGLKGKYILVGLDASGLGSRFATPISHDGKLMSGVELNAHALDMLLKDKSIHYLEESLSVALTVCLVIIPIILYGIIPAQFTFLVFIAFVFLSLAISLYLLLIQHLSFGIIPAIFSISVGYFIWGGRYLGFVSHLLFKEKARARATLQAIGEVVITTDSLGQIEYMNPMAEKISGYSLNQVKGNYFDDTFIIGDINEYYDAIEIMDRVSQSERAISEAQIKCLTTHRGDKYAVQLVVNSIFDNDQKMSGTVYVISDLTDLFNINQQMTHLATHDSLTSLPNRILLNDRLNQALNLARRSKNCVAILFIDLDGFKKINDGLGHPAGDLLLKQVAIRLQESIRKVDTAARWGGDEFVLILETLEHEEYVVEIAEKLLHTISQSINILGQDVFVTPSIGISLFPKDGQTVDDLLAYADAAMYSVKESGRNSFKFYAKELNKKARERLNLEKELHQALLDDDFELYYQPQISLATGDIIGAEALLRWHHPIKGMILPGEFISLAEDIGLIIPIGQWVLKTVCQQLKVWRDQGLPILHIAVNLSARQFLQADLLDIIKKLILDCQIVPNELGLEITESLVMKDIEQVIKILQELKNSGISIAIDDFGTGFSSLNYLNSLPIDVLKIDKSFVNNLFNGNAGDASIIQAIIVLAHKMKMQVVAEGIETLPQLQFLTDELCDIGQGFYFDRPLSASRLVEVVLESHANLLAD